MTISAVSEEESFGGSNEPDDFNSLSRGTPRQLSLNAIRDSKQHNKKKAGLLKGIGSMFRFVNFTLPLPKKKKKFFKQSVRHIDFYFLSYKKKICFRFE